MMVEIWKNIEGYEGRYQVSNLGNVNSLNWHREGRTKNLKLLKHTTGYRQVELWNDKGERHRYLVHRLVAKAFIENTNGYPYINHRDEDKTNNTVSNLEWCSNSYNITYGSHGEANHRDYPHRHLPKPREHGKPRFQFERIAQLTLDNQMVREWDSAIAVNLEKGWNEWSIRQCCRGNRKTAYGYKWQYAT